MLKNIKAKKSKVSKSIYMDL